ncbi:M20 family metallopeptidase [Bacillus fonticola]|uniref:M20 family metallopeptidase n=1 Tax=Bacillus fonticola TaxID=2728853 RepID=UPI0014731A57|nr:M20 family metallopeptidase [Bacillus fonticola]
MLSQILSKLESYQQDTVEIRRYLHQHPELSFQEYETAKYIASFYENIGVTDVRTNVGGNGVVAKIHGAKPGVTVALRADFDALPIQDEKEVPYASKVSGVMHACGHDGHTATLLTLAKVLHEQREQLEGTYVMIHQHAEEYAPGGAIAMIEDGCLEGVDVIFGTHLWATEPTGKIQYRTGPIMAAADRFEVYVQGAGGHGAQPHTTKDAVATASSIVVQLQQLVSRRVDPIDSAVVSVGSFVADNAFNVIADKARLEGTVRTFREEVRNLLENELEQVVKGVCLTNGSTYKFLYHRGYPATVNDEEMTEFFVEQAKTLPDVLQVEETPPQMGGEDFSYYLQHVKGTFFFTGAKPTYRDDVIPHHHPKFDIDEDALLVAAKALATAAVQYQTYAKTSEAAAQSAR